MFDLIDIKKDELICLAVSDGKHSWVMPQEIIRDTLDHIDEITNDHKHLQVEMVWIPGHSGIEGNEQADAEAKKAADSKAIENAQTAKIRARTIH